ncbi:Sec-independent protein translocase protein TatB [Rhodococcus koreensis]|uniref:Sec-independent protein translocase protein TatB n=1 Tax=Rhodococcus koreensis TaxID=99653 RepID=UPI003670C814
MRSLLTATGILLFLLWDVLGQAKDPVRGARPMRWPPTPAAGGGSAGPPTSSSPQPAPEIPSCAIAVAAEPDREDDQMFSNVGWDKMIVLFVAALVVLGPERLPGALRQSLQFLRRARHYVSGATEQLRDELRPALDELDQVFPQPTRHPEIAPHIVLTTHHEGEATIAGRHDVAAGPRPHAPRAPASGAPDDRDEGL